MKFTKFNDPGMASSFALADASCVFMQGASGSGKSFWAQKILQSALDAGRTAKVFSADLLLGVGGQYLWSPEACYLAHRLKIEMLKVFLAGTENPFVIMDDTNLKAKDILAVASLFPADAKAVIAEVNAGLEFTAERLAERNRHGVPVETIRRQMAALQTFDSTQIPKLKESP